MSNQVEIANCDECGEPIETRWVDGRGVLLPVLIADWVFHAQCWEKIAERGSTHTSVVGKIFYEQP